MAIESSVTLHAIRYNVQMADEWCAVFTQADPIGNRPTRFMMHRDKHSLWRFKFCDGWGDPAACHIAAAYEWCMARIGNDHAQKRLPENEFIKHDLEFNKEKQRTFCKRCGIMLSDQTEFVSCVKDKNG